MPSYEKTLRKFGSSFLKNLKIEKLSLDLKKKIITFFV